MGKIVVDKQIQLFIVVKTILHSYYSSDDQQKTIIRSKHCHSSIECLGIAI